MKVFKTYMYPPIRLRPEHDVTTPTTVQLALVTVLYRKVNLEQHKPEET